MARKPDYSAYASDVVANWTKAFTALLRQEKARAWGNWTFDPKIKAGSVGWMDLAAGEFQLLTELGSVAVDTEAQPNSWALMTENVQQTKANVDFKGGYEDPSTGTNVDVGIQANWQFSSEGAVAAHGTCGYTNRCADFLNVLRANFDFLHSVAEKAGYAEGDGIKQGFGVVTGSWLVDGGVHLGSVSSDAEFSITGSVTGVTSMLGEGDTTASGSLRGSFKNTDRSGTLNVQMFPSTPNSVADVSAAYAYEFASFDGQRILPQWIEFVQDGTIWFDNGHGGTYIVDCKVTYDQPGKINQTKGPVTVAGSGKVAISGIPTDAVNIAVSCEFRGIQTNVTKTLKAESPLFTWPASTVTVDIYGVWANEPWIEWRKTDS